MRDGHSFSLLVREGSGSTWGTDFLHELLKKWTVKKFSFLMEITYLLSGSFPILSILIIVSVWQRLRMCLLMYALDYYEVSMQYYKPTKL